MAMGRGAFNNNTQYYNISIISSSTYSGRYSQLPRGALLEPLVPQRIHDAGGGTVTVTEEAVGTLAGWRDYRSQRGPWRDCRSH